MTVQRFKSTITKSGSRTIIPVPFDPDEVWGAKAQHYITGSVNGCRIRGKLESDGSEYFFSIGPAWRRDNGLEAGTKVSVELQPEGPQSANLSADITAALDAAPEAQAYFDSLASFYRNNFIRWIESAKRPETRKARIDRMVEALKNRQRSI